MGNALSKRTRFAASLSYDQQLADMLANATLNDVEGLDEQKLIFFDSTEPLGDCFHKLLQHGIHSAPVYNSEQGEWVGLLDWKDLAYYVLKICGLGRPNEEQLELKDTPVAGEAVNLSRLNPFFPLFRDSNLLEVIQGMSSDLVHRRPVIDPNAKEPTILAMVSQTDLIRWLWKHERQLRSSMGNKTLEVVEREEERAADKLPMVLCVPPDVKMLFVLELLLDNGINGVGVIDRHPDFKDAVWATGSEKLIGNISVSDLKYLVEENFENLQLTVEEFLNKVERHPLVCLPPTATLLDAVGKLAETGVCRLYVTGDNQSPLAVLTLTDVLRAVAMMATKEEPSAAQ